jgi:hypothetical protein
MPVKKVERLAPGPVHQMLLQRLLEEWTHPNPAAQQPIILEESTGANQPMHVYVIWDEWTPLGSIERSEVVMDAYEQRYGRAAGANVTVAMGLTPVEADRLGIKYR